VKRVLILALTIACVAPLAARDLVLVTGAGPADVRTIEQLGAVVNDAREGSLTAEADADQQAALRALGFTVKVRVPNIDQVYRDNSLDLGTDAWYMPYATFADTMRTIAQNNSSFIRLETLGYSVGNRALLALKFSDNPGIHQDEPAVHFEADIHGDEKIGWGILFEMVKYLAANYGTDTLVTRLVDSREIWLHPMYNPDGYEASRRYNGNNVDLNRNWGWMWGGESGQGASVLSEPENRAVLGHILRHPFVMFISYHAGTEFISYPWSYQSHDSIPEKPLIHFLSQRYAVPNGYEVGQGAIGMYEINGSTKDFDYGQGMMGWSIEVHYSKTPPASEIVPTFNRNSSAILEFFHRAGQGIHGTVTDAVNGRPVHTMVTVGAVNWPSYTDTALGDFHRFYLPGTCSVTFRAPGYRDTTINGVVVPNSGDSSVTLDVQLQPEPTAPLFGFRHIYNAYIASPSSNRTWPVRALGAHDGVHFQLDNGKYICIDMDRPVRDQSGDDLVVFRNGGSGSATVKGSNAWDGTWTTIGTASSDESSFDLDAVGLDSVRFIRLEASGAFYIDAVEGVNYTGLNGEPVARLPALSLSPVVNPATGTVRLRFNRPPAPGTHVQVLDASGRVIRTIAPEGTTLAWDRSDERGRGIAPGVYFCRVAGPEPAEARLVLAR
jgi:hypothetical protein